MAFIFTAQAEALHKAQVKRASLIKAKTRKSLETGLKAVGAHETVMAGVGSLQKMGSSMKDMVEEVIEEATGEQKHSTHRPFWVPRKFITRDPVNGKEQIHEVGFFARVFITFEHPGLSTFGQIYSTLMMLLIFTSCTCYVLATMPEFMYIPTKNKCAGKWCEDAWKICSDEQYAGFNEAKRSCGMAPDIFMDDAMLPGSSDNLVERCVCVPIPYPWLDTVETISVLAFSFDYLLTFLTVWAVSSKIAGVEKVPKPEDEDDDSFHEKKKKKDSDEEEPPPPHHDLFHTDIPEVGACTRTYRFATQTMNIIDLVAIVPFYVGLAAQGADIPGISVVRVLRLARIFRVFRIGKFNEGLGLFTRTMSASSPALILLSFFYLLGCVLFGSIIHFAEQGEFIVNKNYPQGAWLRYDEYRQPPDELAERDESGRFIDFYVESPFRSIPYAFYWTIVTGTTVGYGDMFPLTGLGKLFAVVTMTCGILVLALPITVIGSNFSREYAKVTGEVDEWEELLNGFDDVSDDEEEAEQQGRFGSKAAGSSDSKPQLPAGNSKAGANDKSSAVQNTQSGNNNPKSPKKVGKTSKGKKPNLKDIINLTIRQQQKVAPAPIADDHRSAQDRTAMKLRVMRSFSNFSGIEDELVAGDEVLPLNRFQSKNSFASDPLDNSDGSAGLERMMSAGADARFAAGGKATVETSGPVAVPPVMMQNMASEIKQLKTLLLHLGSTVENLETQLITMSNQSALTSMSSITASNQSALTSTSSEALTQSSGTMKLEEFKEDDDRSGRSSPGISAGSGKFAPVGKLDKQGSVRALSSTAGVTSGAGAGSFDLKVNFDDFTGVMSQHEVAHVEKPKPKPTPTDGVPLQTAEDPDEMVFTRIDVYEDAPVTRLMNRAMSVSAFSRHDREAQAARATPNQREEYESRTSGASTDSEAMERARRNSADTAKTKAISDTSSSDDNSRASPRLSFTSSEGTPSPRSAVRPGTDETRVVNVAAQVTAVDDAASEGMAAICVAADVEEPKIGERGEGGEEKRDMVMALDEISSPTKAAAEAAASAAASGGGSAAKKRSRLERMRSFKEIGKSVRWGQSLRQIWIQSRNFENLGASSRDVRVKVHSLAGMPRTDIGLRGHAPLTELQVTVSTGTQKHTTSPRHIRSNLTWEDESFDLRIPVSTHTGTLMLKYVEAEVHCGDTFLGMCSIPLSEVDGSTHEYRLMTRNDANGGRRPALAGKGRILMSLEWQKIELGPDSGREHTYGTSLGRVLALGKAYTEKLTDESWRQPPSYPQLAARRAYGPKKSNSLQSRSLSPGTSMGTSSSFRGGDSGASAGNKGHSHMQGSSRPIYPSSRHLSGRMQGQSQGQHGGGAVAEHVPPQTSPSGSRDSSPRDESLELGRRSADAEAAGASTDKAHASPEHPKSMRHHNVPVLEFSYMAKSASSRKAARDNLRKFTGGGSAANMFEAAIRRKKLQHAASRMANSGSGQLQVPLSSPDLR